MSPVLSTAPSPPSINPAGAVTGYSVDANFVGHGFLRASNGTLTTLDARALVQQALPPPLALTPGVIAGMYTDANNGSHGFLRARDGTFTTFDPPGSIFIFAPHSFGPGLYINPDGVITGTYFEPFRETHSGVTFESLYGLPMAP